MMYLTDYLSPWGKLRLVSNGQNLTELRLPGQKNDSAAAAKAVLTGKKTGADKETCTDKRTAAQLPVLVQTKLWLDRYFAGQDPNPQALPLQTEGTEFQERVWQLLREIPYGQTVTYGQLARRLEKQQEGPGQKIAVRAAKKDGPILGIADPRRHLVSARAVGGAVGRNPIAIIIPCHRVVGADGSLTGYAGGLKLKQKLLQLEGIKL